MKTEGWGGGGGGVIPSTFSDADDLVEFLIYYYLPVVTLTAQHTVFPPTMLFFKHLPGVTLSQGLTYTAQATVVTPTGSDL